MKYLCYLCVLAVVIAAVGFALLGPARSRGAAKPGSSQAPKRVHGEHPVGTETNATTYKENAPAEAPNGAHGDQPTYSESDLLLLARQQTVAPARETDEGIPDSDLARALADSDQAAALAIDLIASGATPDELRRALKSALPATKRHRGWTSALRRLADIAPRLADAAARARLADALVHLAQNEDPPPEVVDLLVLWARSEASEQTQGALLASLERICRTSLAVQRLMLDIARAGTSPATGSATSALGLIIDADGPNAREALDIVLSTSSDVHQPPVRRTMMLGTLLARRGTVLTLREAVRPYQSELVTTWSNVFVDASQNEALRAAGFNLVRVVDPEAALDLGARVVHSDSDTRFREYVFSQFESFPDSARLENMLLEALASSELESSAIQSLAKHGDERALAALEPLTRNPNPAICSSARVAIDEINKRLKRDK